jgi:hypothetical protein
MTPEFRKIASETLLHKRGIRINPQLPEIESSEEVNLRSSEDLFRRMVALWAVVGKARQGCGTYFCQYILSHEMQSWLSEKERGFLFDDGCNDEDRVYFRKKREALFFLAWCGGLVTNIEMPADESDTASVVESFPLRCETPVAWQATIHVRSKEKILDWADLLYRLHWAVRHAMLIGKPVPGNVNPAIVQEWHQAVNWMIRYDDEDNWDCVGTDI